MWNLSTQVNGSDPSVYITVFDQRMGKHRLFIPFLVYDLFYPSIASNFVILDTLSPWSESVCIYTLSSLLRKPLLRKHRTVETRLLINL